MGMYLLGFAAAILSAVVMKYVIRAKGRGFLIMELPEYRWPRWRNVGLTVVQKSRTFVWEAGRVILAVSVVLWVLASYGPGDSLQRAEAEVRANDTVARTAEELDNAVASVRLENSYAGRLGHWIEPVIRPLGYDWKIGIALVTSFAAREVFVGTMATLYSVGADFEDDSTIKSRMREEINPATGERQFTPAVAFSLLVFYAFAMQCMSTIAIVHRETQGLALAVDTNSLHDRSGLCIRFVGVSGDVMRDVIGHLSLVLCHLSKSYCMKKTLSFEELEVYQVAEQLCDHVWEVVQTWDYLAKNTVGTQLVRSADSIGANIAEGTGRGSFADNKRFVRMARGSLYETRHWLRRAYQRKLLSHTDIDLLKTLMDELSPRLNAYLNSIGKNAKKT